MKVLNGKGGLIAKISAAVVMVAAILGLYWQLSDRVQAVADDAKVEAIEFAKVEDGKVLDIVSKEQQRNSLRFWMQQRDLARIELKRIRRGLSHHPNDPNLLEDKEYWEEMYNKAQEELDKILNP